MKSKIETIAGVQKWTNWWINQRKQKLEEQLSDTMSVNPFMMPFLFDYHNIDDFEGLVV